ncbi:MAG TPA: hypothetical protein VL404_00240 [Candidatus Eisenbacteria bacterium]|nr:hypothetical protein [Candidatus Eisenbacteria bacterium]
MKRSIIEAALCLALSMPSVTPALAAAATQEAEVQTAKAGTAGTATEPGASAPASPASEAPEAPVPGTEKEYYGVKVLLVDPKAGYLGVLFTDQDSGKSEKLSFRVDPENVDVINKLNKYLEFSDIVIGSNLDLYTIIEPDGKETVDEIVAYDINPD